MGANRKAAVRELASASHELESSVLEGHLKRSPDGGWIVGDVPLGEWLVGYEGEEIVLIAASLEDERALPIRTCRACGADYEGVECPRCRDARMRLRGAGG